MRCARREQQKKVSMMRRKSIRTAFSEKCLFQQTAEREMKEIQRKIEELEHFATDISLEDENAKKSFMGTEIKGNLTAFMLAEPSERL
jgi:hypothetical protein